jgi:oxalate decarboxylase/phosphoglucose isomerase-like protein (cupin superfamily)
MEDAAAHPQVEPALQKPYEIFNGGLEWRVDGSQFPISTGVVLEMEAGALRELHWHPTAAEWQSLGLTRLGTPAASAYST